VDAAGCSPRRPSGTLRALPFTTAPREAVAAADGRHGWAEQDLATKGENRMLLRDSCENAEKDGTSLAP
jgi:hypothetical protein